MRLTSSFAVFRADPGEEALARARSNSREGRVDAAEREYRAALAEHPDLTTGWVELFDLLRRAGRLTTALETAESAEAHYGPQAAVPLALKGAALSELGRTREAVEALEGALERDGNLALAWHELAYAAWRVGEHARALLALDRAFALEPHTDSLMLRGRILRDAGQYEAALVAFEGAAQSATHEPQRHDADLAIAVTRRSAALGPRRPRTFSRRERVFAETGAALLDASDGTAALEPILALCMAAFPALARAAGWHPAAVAALHPSDAALAEAIARALGADPVALAALDPADQPLIVTVHQDGGEDWSKQAERLARWRSGFTFALVQAPGLSQSADVVGTIRAVSGPNEASLALAAALARPLPATPDITEAAALAANPEAPWRRRRLSEAELAAADA